MDRHVLSLSYGKDSLACLGAIEKLGWKLDEIVHAEVWATDDIPAELPPMVEFKAKADKIIKDRWGIEVKHICATCDESKKVNFQNPPIGVGGYKYTYNDYFYHRGTKGKFEGNYQGFPTIIGGWCHKLKFDFGITKYFKKDLPRHLLQDSSRAIQTERSDNGISNDERELVYRGTEDSKFNAKHRERGADINIVQYLGIAADEPERIARHTKKGFLMPLVELGWTEADAKQWCIENDLLSPIYTDRCMRGGCWFCHNQGIDQLRQLRHNYPELWELLLKWDNDSPVSFHADGKTVHDFDRRFYLEDEGLVRTDRKFRWRDINEVQLKLF